MQTDCVICNINAKKEKGFIVFEDDDYLVFLDTKPLFKGHCLLAPKQHVRTLYELPTEMGNSFLSTIQSLGKAIKKAFQAEGTFIAINNEVSQSIPHLHAHIVPRNKGDGLKGFFWPRIRYESEAEMQEIQSKIQQYL